MAFFVSAVVAAVEVTTVATVALAVSEVGMALSVTGMVTGNKDLMKIGGVMGLAGGIAGLANSAFNTATTTAVQSATQDVTQQSVDQSVNSVATDAPISDVQTMPVNSPPPTEATDLAQAPATPAPDAAAVPAGAPAIPPVDPTASALGANPSTGGASLSGNPAASNGIIGNASSTGLNPAAAPTNAALGSTDATGLNAADPQAVEPANTPAAGTSVAAAPTAPASVTAAPAQTAQAQTAFQLGNQSGATMDAGSANLVQGSQMSGVSGAPAPTIPSGMSVDQAYGNTVDATGANTNPYNPAPNTPASNDFFSGVSKFMSAPPSGGSQLVGGLLAGAGSGYAGMKNYELGQGQLALAQEKQAGINAQPKFKGIISSARKSSFSGS